MTHVISEWFLEAANHTCGPYDPDVDEMKLANLTPLKSHVVRSMNRVSPSITSRHVQPKTSPGWESAAYWRSI